MRTAGVIAEGLNEPTVIAALQERGVVCDDRVRAAVAAAVAYWQADPAAGGEVVVAEGAPAEHGRNGRHVWAPQTRLNEPPKTEDGVDFYATRLVMVDAGSTLATLAPPTEGKSGMNVYGQALAAKPGKPARRKCCTGCHYTDDGTLVADLSGVLHVGGSTIAVRELLDIRGNVNFTTGHVRARGDVRIGGHVADLFEVTAAGSVFIKGFVNAATIRAAKDVEVLGALTNHRKGLCTAGRNIRATLADNSILFARGDVRVAKEVVQSDTFACGEVRAEALRGGVTVAAGGVDVRILGSPAMVKTLVVAGVDWTLPGLLRTLEAAAEKIQEELQGGQAIANMLRSNHQRLTPQQKETLSELELVVAYQRGKLDALQAEAQEARRRSGERSKAQVTVRGEVYQGVELRLGNLSTITALRIAGPVTFEIVGHGPHAAIAAVEKGARPMVLPSRRLADPLVGITLPQ